MTPMARSEALARRLGLTPAEARILRRLDRPQKVQDFLARLPANHEPGGDSCLSVRGVLRERRAHCIEGAFVAACAFWLAGRPPLLMDMQAEGDDDHVIAIFRQRGHWGAISKSNHIWLRYRDPIYRTLRELAISYFHEYVNNTKRTLRTYSRPYDLRRIDPELWVTNPKNCWDVAEALDDITHYRLVSRAQARLLSRRDRFEIETGRLVEYAKPAAAMAAGIRRQRKPA
jgi:hypothetical protein